MRTSSDLAGISRCLTRRKVTQLVLPGKLNSRDPGPVSATDRVNQASVVILSLNLHPNLHLHLGLPPEITITIRIKTSASSALQPQRVLRRVRGRGQLGVAPGML